MIDSEAVAKSIVNSAGIYGRWRRTFEREDDAEQVRRQVAARIDLNLFDVERDGTDVVVEPHGTAPHIGWDPLDEDSGYGPDSYFGRSMQRDD